LIQLTLRHAVPGAQHLGQEMDLEAVGSDISCYTMVQQKYIR
jgi:hypothetical protein